MAGPPVTISQWTAHSGAHLVNVELTLGGNTYDVMGINCPLATAEQVAASLIHT